MTTINEGLAASAASVIFQAGDVRVSMPSTRQMIHRAWTVGIGNANEMREIAELLDEIDGDLAGLYAGASGMSVDEIMPLLDAETWFSAEESVQQGFADRVGPEELEFVENRLSLLRARVRLASLA